MLFKPERSRKKSHYHHCSVSFRLDYSSINCDGRRGGDYDSEAEIFRIELCINQSFGLFMSQMIFFFFWTIIVKLFPQGAVSDSSPHTVREPGAVCESKTVLCSSAALLLLVRSCTAAAAEPLKTILANQNAVLSYAFILRKYIY